MPKNIIPSSVEDFYDPLMKTVCHYGPSELTLCNLACTSNISMSLIQSFFNHDKSLHRALFYLKEQQYQKSLLSFSDFLSLKDQLFEDFFTLLEVWKNEKNIFQAYYQNIIFLKKESIEFLQHMGFIIHSIKMRLSLSYSQSLNLKSTNIDYVLWNILYALIIAWFDDTSSDCSKTMATLNKMIDKKIDPLLI